MSFGAFIHLRFGKGDFRRGKEQFLLRCALCLAGREHLCETLELIGYAIDGGFAEFLRVPARAVAAGNVVQLDQDVAPTELALADLDTVDVDGLGHD